LRRILRVTSRVRERVVPSAKDGLHCGKYQFSIAQMNGCKSSRPPRTGSIAADIVSHRHRIGEWSSRPPRTGSIAASADQSGPGAALAVVPSAKDGLHCGCRSPRASWALTSVVPSAKDGLHCGRVRRRTLDRSFQVVPSAKDGLHCGTEHKADRIPDEKSSRPPRTGSIAALNTRQTEYQTKSRPVRQGRAPLRHEQLVGGAGALAGRPVRQGRAPLRLAHGVERQQGTGVVPSAKDGLHCGGDFLACASQCR